MDALNKMLTEELQPPKVGSVHPCSACGESDVAQYLGTRKGKGRWKWLKQHTLTECRKRQASES